MKETEHAKQLADDHAAWVAGYNKALGLTMIPMQAAEYLYRTAIYHGVGHGIEAERGGMFRPSIGEPLTTGEIAAIARPCSNCMDEVKCGGGLRLASGDCLHYRPNADHICKTCAMENQCALNTVCAVSCTAWQPKIADQQYPKVG